MDMLTMSTPRLTTRSAMPSVSATDVQPPPQVQAREETIFAPGATPSMAPPNRSLPAAMPATCEPWASSTMPMFTKSAVPGSPAGVTSTSSRYSTTNGICSRTPVEGSSAPKRPTSNLSLYGRMSASSVKSLFWLTSTQMSWVTGS